ncbi:MAG: hypothetical protein WB508_03145 [Aeromicrobium sp.]|uniref:hypothetical protein n=1 Tax=Aeromicrobium sp. TaxID=1871063 RepID=UPI003C3B794C
MNDSISTTRIALAVAGIAGLLWGIWSLRDDGLDALVSVAIWLGGAIIVHDGIVAPLTIGVTLLAAKFLPPAARMPAVVAFIVWATCSIAAVAVLTGHAAKAGNETIGGRPYTLAWVIFTLALVAAATVASVLRSRRAS